MTSINLSLSKEDKELLAEVIRDSVKSEVRDAIRQIKMEMDMPEILTKKDVMAALDISRNKVTELFVNRPDFPVSRQVGEASPRVHRNELIEWMFPKDKELRKNRAKEFDMSQWDRIS